MCQKQFFTSYLGNVKNLPDSLIPIFVATRWPDKPLFSQIDSLAPWKIIGPYKRGEINAKQYTELYNKQLANLSYDQVVAEIFALAENKIPCLICYETPEKFCHRHLIAKWITDHGDSCEEWSNMSALLA